MSAAADGQVAELAERLYATERSRLLRVARSNTDDADDAEEAVNQGFLLFITKFDPDCFDEPLAWLTTVIKRECWALRRKRHPDKLVYEAEAEAEIPGFNPEQLRSEAAGPAERFAVRELSGEIREAFAQLTASERDVLGLLALGYSYKEITGLRGYTHTKINRCAAEGRAKLRELGLDIYKSH